MAESRSKSQRFTSPPHSSRSDSHMHRLRSPRTFASAAKQRNSHVPSASPLRSEVSPRDEIRLLRMQLSASRQEISQLKDRYSTDVSQLRTEIQSLRRDLDLLRFERDEAEANAADPDITNLASLVISMRTEIDRMSASLWRHQRDNAISRDAREVLRGRGPPRGVPVANNAATERITVNPNQFVLRKNRSLKEDYDTVRTLGQGTFGRVYMVRNKVTGVERAAKEVAKKSELESSALVTEVKSLASLDHPNVLKIYELYEDSQKIYSVSELLTGGELFDYIKKSPHGLAESKAARIMAQLLSAISLTHCHDITHKDLKPENILLEKQPGTGDVPTVKIVNFGTSALIHTVPLSSRIGSRYYMSPEACQGIYEKPGDIWSLGVMLYILLCGYPPFNGVTDSEIRDKIVAGEVDVNNGVWQRISSPAKDLVQMMLRKVESRVTAEEALASPWIRDSQSTTAEDAQEAGEVLENFKKFKGELELRQILSAFVVSHFSTHEVIEKLRETFQALDKDHSGMLTRSELLAGLSQQMSQDEAELEVDALFSSVDMNHTGTVDYSEFLTAAAFSRKKVTIEQLKSAFESLDLDKSGKISVKELQNLLGAGVSGVDNWKQLLAQADVDADGEISLPEFVSFLLNERF